MRKTSLVLAVLLAVAGICVVLWPVVTGHKLQADTDAAAQSFLEERKLEQQYDRMFACREELQQVRADIAAIEKATPASGDLDSQLKAARAEIEQCKLKLQYLAQYISKRAEMTFSALKMNRVEISLYDVVKSTGEVKDAFKFTYNG